MEIKELLEKYPFLEFRDVSGELTADNEENRLNYNYWTCWDGYGWEKIWKKYLSVLFEEYNKLSDDEKKKFRILDTKEKYGSLRVDVSCTNEVMREAESILEMLSQWTCSMCGKMPRNSKGNRIIWETKGWICPFCKDCLKKEMKGNWTLKYTNWKVREFKRENEGFILKRWDKNGTFKYVYKDLGDWLKLDKIIQEEKHD